MTFLGPLSVHPVVASEQVVANRYDVVKHARRRKEHDDERQPSDDDTVMVVDSSQNRRHNHVPYLRCSSDQAEAKDIRGSMAQVWGSA
jgi:hypothetical protein